MPGVTLAAGILTGINGAATIIEAGTNYNFVRDGVFQGNETAYFGYSSITESVAIIGSMVLGVYQTTGQYKAAKYGREFLGKGYTKVGDGRWVSQDGLRQMMLDTSHHFIDGVPSSNHFNLYRHETSIFLGRSKILEKIHVFYKWFQITIR